MSANALAHSWSQEVIQEELDKDIMSSDAETQPGKTKLKIRDADAPRSDSSLKESKSRAKKNGSWTEKLFALEDWGKWLLAIVILIAPWWLGSVGSLPQFLINGVVVVCLLIWLGKCFLQKESYRPHLISMLVLLFPHLKT